MKTLKFEPALVSLILSGKKTSTWRLFDDKDLNIGDQIIFINKESGEEFGEAVITILKTTTLGSLTAEDWVGHEKYPSEDAMYESYRRYYGDRVGPDSDLKLLTFTFTPKSPVEIGSKLN